MTEVQLVAAARRAVESAPEAGTRVAFDRIPTITEFELKRKDSK